MAANLLEDSLRSLHKLHEDSGGGAKEQIDTIIGDVVQICLNEVTEKDFDYSCSVLFDKEIGVVRFLQKIVTIEEFQSCKASLLDLLSGFTEKVGKKILDYAVDIKEVSFSLFMRDRFAKVKNAAIPVLIKLLEVSVGTQLGEQLKISKLIEKLFLELTKASSKLQPSVKANVYQLLGVIAEVYPELMAAYSDRLVGLYVTALKAEMESKTRKPELQIIAGCLEGLTAYLVNFTQSADEGSKNSYAIFKYARMSIDPSISFSRYDVPRGGLRLFGKHCSQFNQYIVDDYEGMYEKLLTWNRHHNRELAHLGMVAMEAFLKQVAEMLVVRAQEGKKEGAVFKFFVKQFRDIMNNNSSGAKEVSLAIRGYGLLAAPCRSFLSSGDVQFMFSEMITKCEQQFLGQVDDLEEKIISLPSYLEALAYIVKEVSQVSDTYAATLEHLLVLILENFPLVHHKLHFYCQKSMLQVLLALMAKGTTFQQVLSGMVYQGLIRTCSHPVVLDTEQTDEQTPVADVTEKKVTYKDYIDLWQTLLNSARIKDFASEEISIADRHRLTEAMYDELMNSILRVLSKLDLSSAAEQEGDAASTSSSDDAGGTSADPTSGVHANRPRDFQVLINLVDFSRDLLPVCHFELFNRWVFTYCHSIILLSTQNPLVSGFYKMLAVAMKIANKLEYFKDVAPSSPVKFANSMEVDDAPTEGSQQKSVSYQLMKKFSKEVLVRMKQYRDDLLAACLTLILSLPKEIIAEQMADVVPAIQVTLNLGLSYLPLAVVGLDALEYWSAHLPNHIIHPHYPMILPCLDSYLRTVDKGAEEVNVDSTVTLKSSKSRRSQSKVTVRKVKGQSKPEEKSYQSQLAIVKQRIMHYLGSLGGSVNHALLAHADEQISKQAITWDTRQHLKFDMPFVDMKPVIYFDQFLPHVVELASKSGDRQTKVAACELLHSLVLYTLGRGAQLPGDRQKKMPMEKLYKKLFPAILQLACDVELVARQLFEPLMMQLIHWFTNNKMGESVETMALLDTIFDGIIQPTDTALRDFSAKCLQEFLRWSLKQASKKTVEKSPVNAKSLLKRMFSYSVHPSAFKRLGAALAFNNIYTVFREEDSLVDRFTFQILVHFVESLSIAHTDEKSLGTREQCTKALEHLEKIIRGRTDLLKKESKNRDEPKEWSKKTLDIAVRWLTRQCGRPQTDCRHACMKLVYKLAPFIPGIKEAKNYFQTFLKSKDGAGYFLSRFEGGSHAEYGKMGLSKCTQMENISETFSVTAALAWFDMFLAPLDCYTWVFGEDLLTPGDLFTSKKSPSMIWDTIQYFCDSLALGGIQDAADLFKHQSAGDFYTPREIDDYNRAKCTLIIRIWNFFLVIFGKSWKDAYKPADSVLSKNLWKLLSRCVVQPSSIGFNMGDVEIMVKLPQEMEQILYVLTRSLPDKHLKELKKTLATELTGDRDVVGMLPISLTDPGLDHPGFEQLVSGYRLLHKHGLLMDAVKYKGGPEKLARQVMDTVYQGVVQKKAGQGTMVSLTPTALSLARALLQLAFQLGLPGVELVDELLEGQVVVGLSQGLEQSHGDLFFTLFKSTVSGHMAQRADKIVPLLAKKAAKEPRRVSSILVSLVDHVSKDRALRKREGERVLSAILNQWECFKPWVDTKTTADQQEMAVLLMTKMLLVDSKVASNTAHASYSIFYDMYQTLVTDNRTSLAFKNRVLDLLAFFSVVGDPHIGKLKSTLDRFVADNFPLKSAEFTKGTPKFNDYITAIDKLLAALELSGSPVLLELIISVFCRESQHAHEDEIQDSLSRFIKRLPGDKQKTVLDVPYKIFLKEGSFPNEIRRATIERVCLPMLRLAQKSALIEFFLDHVVEIMKMVETKLVRGPQSALETQLISKYSCFQLLELLYSRMTKDEINTKNSTINEKFCLGNASTGKELTTKLLKAAQEARSEDVRGETTLLEIRRQYHCAAYNLMIAVISCTQSEARFYVGFLFSDNEAKGQFLLDNIVDKDKVYEFPVEFQSPMERKKRFVSIRKEARERRVDEGEEGSISYGSSYHLASQYLADSSLSEDVNQYDFTMSGSAQSAAGDRPRVRRKTSFTDVQDEEMNVTVEDDYVVLEMDDLNKHECMAAMIALLKHMQRAEITPAVAQGSLPKEMPKWMSNLETKMTSPSVHHNIKLFIAKLIINTADIFQPYAKFWLRPLCQLLFSGPLSSTGINYFIIDVVVTMLSWHTTAIPQDSGEEKAMASRLVKFLTANIYQETRSVFRNNIDMLKTLLECWRGRLEIPYDVIYGQLKTSDPKSKDSLTGIQVLGVVIACKYAPYGPVAPVDREKYFSVVTSAMGNHYKTTYAAAAEVVGMIFKHLAERESETEGSFHDYVVNYLSSLQMAKPDNFITCVHRMQRHYPAISVRFLNKLLFMLPNLHGEFRSHCLEVIHSGIDRVENVYLEMKSKGLTSFLTHRDEATQQMALQIVKSISAKLRPAELSALMPAICGFCQHPSTACRNVMYQILMWIYDNYREDETAESHQIMQQTKETLLRGLGDDDLHCRLLVQNFWSSETRLPASTLDRMVAMLEAMYSPSTEQQYLSYATNLLLEMTSKSPDYQREIFEHALSECKFQDYSIHSSWRQRHAVMTPLFASTMASQTMDQSMSEDTLDGGVRATVDVAQFSQTQEGGSRAPFNWLTQSSLDTFSDAFTLGGDTQSQSSMLFGVGGGERRSRSRRSGSRPAFGQRASTSGAASAGAGSSSRTGAGDGRRDESGEQNEILRLKRRFLKDQESSRLFFIKRQTRLNRMREEAQKEQQKRRENQVTMYRKYRIGDLPDIQIKYSYIIAPLQALAHRDSTVAKMLFSSLFKAIFAEMDEVKTAREIEEMTEEINNSLETVLSSSSQYFPPFVSCVMDILYELRNNLKVLPSTLGACAVISNLQPLGMTVMEEQLIQYSPEEAQPRKRGRTDTTLVSLDTSLWIELARLYKSVDEYDVLQGIFSGKIQTKSVTQEALKAESRGDYQTARKLYEEALTCEKWSDGDPTDAEVDLWDDARMECLDHLTQWSALQEVCETGIDNTGSGVLANVWEDSFAQEHYLPFLVRSKVKLMLQGDEGQQTLLSFIDEAMKEGERKALLESRYCFELALMYLWQEDYDRARHYSTMASNKFLQDWSSTDTLLATSRTQLLQRLQPLMELQEFLTFWGKEGNFSSAGTAQHLVRQWEKRSPHLLLDATDTWDDVITNRNVYLDLINGRLMEHSRNESSEEMMEADMFEESKLRLKLAMAESTRDQKNFTLTLRILKETHSGCKRSGNECLLVEWNQLYASTHQQKALSFPDQWTDDMVNNILTTIDQLGKYSESGVLSECPDLGRRHSVLTGHAFEILVEGLNTLGDMKDLSRKTLDKLQEYGGKSGKLEEMTNKLVEHGFQKIKTSISSRYDRESKQSKFGCDEAYLAVAKYCDKVLRELEDEGQDPSTALLKTFPETVVVCMLKAMKLGSAEARERFPRLMQIVEYYPETVTPFREKSSEVPNWMFILWLGQMMALLDKPEARAVQPIVISLATDYPQAVVYAFRISCEGFMFGKSSQDVKNKETVEQISSLLTEDRAPLVAKLISALNQFGQPDMLFKDWAADMIKLLQSSKKTKEKIVDLYSEMYDCLILDRPTASVSDTSGSQLSILSSSVIVGMGEYRKKFAEKFKKDMDSQFGKSGSKLVNMSFKEFKKVMQHFTGEFDKLKEGKAGMLIPPITLKQYCQWMADFNPNRESRELEIPGQYDGLSKPLPEYHVKVAGFDERVLVMASIRRPKRITIRGNDERDYHYLVKGGEDLRQDQRIEQLFVIMNKVLAKDPACRQRKLKLKTYQVIAMTPRVGLIEWMNNTCPLKDFLLDALTDDEKKFYNSDQGPGKVHQRWTGKFYDERKGTGLMYSQVYLKYSKTETEREFRLKENKVPWDLSRRAFHQMSTSPEAFHVLRCALATSHAVISICQYLLGIGDRHLSNFMVNLKTGHMVGIDFGHAFGSATQFLPVPELMPLRMTRQILNVMLPLQAKGLLENTMIHVLRALRRDHDLLLSTMDVFVKEPSVDWLQFAEKQKQVGTETEDADIDAAWYPKQKIQFAHRKLKGDNPAYITRDELRLGHIKNIAIKSFEDVALGNKKDNVRAQLPQEGLTVEQQVAALIDQATDPNLLGRVWAGWEPWV